MIVSDDNTFDVREKVNWITIKMNFTEMDIEDKWMEMYDSSVNFVLSSELLLVVLRGLCFSPFRVEEKEESFKII